MKAEIRRLSGTTLVRSVSSLVALLVFVLGGCKPKENTVIISKSHDEYRAIASREFQLHYTDGQETIGFLGSKKRGRLYEVILPGHLPAELDRGYMIGGDYSLGEGRWLKVYPMSTRVPLIQREPAATVD